MGIEVRAVFFSSIAGAFLLSTYLARIAHATPEVVVQTGPKGVSWAALSLDGAQVAAAGSTLQLYDAKSGALLRVLRSETVYALGFRPGGHDLACTGGEHNKNTIDFIDIRTGRKTGSVTTGTVRAEGYIRFSADGSYLATRMQYGQAIYVFSVSGGRRAPVLIPAERPFALSPDGSRLAGVDKATGAVRLWNTRSGRPIGAPSQIKKPNDLVFTPDGELIIAGGTYDRSRGVATWNPATGQHRRIINIDGAKHIAVSPDGRRMAVIGSKLWKNSGYGIGYALPSFREQWRHETPALRSLRVTNDRASALEFKKGVATFAGGWNELRVLDVQRGTQTAVIQGEGHLSRNATFAGDFILVAGGKNVRVFDARTGQARAPLPCQWPLATSPKADRVACTVDNSRVAFFELSTGRRISMTARKYTVKVGSGVYQIALSPDGQQAAVSGASGKKILGGKQKLDLWRVSNGQQIAAIDFEGDSGLAFSPNGRRLVAIPGLSKSAAIIDVARRRRVRTLRLPKGERGFLEGVRYSADGRRIVIGGDYYSHSVHVFPATGGKRSRRLKVRKQGFVRYATPLPDGSIIAGTQGGRIRRWSKSGRLRRTIDVTPGLGVGLVSVSASPDGRHAIAIASYESRVWLYDLRSGRRIATLAMLGDTDWAAVGADGHFDGSSAGIERVQLVDGLRPIALGRLLERLHTPRLIGTLLQGKTVAAPPNALEQKLADRAPTVAIVSPTDGTVSSDQAVKVRVKATDQGGGVDEIRLYLNGKLVSAQTRAFRRINTQFDFNVVLARGQNVFSATAFSKARTESAAATVRVRLKAPERTAKLYLVVVGVSSYKNARYTLAYAKPDAVAFLDAVRQRARRMYRDIVVFDLYDDQATRESIEDAFAQVAKAAHPEDVLIFYYAGHGTMSHGGPSAADFFLAPHDVVRLYGADEHLAQRGLSAAKLRELSVAVRAQKQVHILDACQAGAAVEAFTVRGAAEERALVQLARSAGIAVLAAARSDQAATEVKALGHGIFTYAVLEGLGGKADGGRPPDGKVTVKELEAFLNDQVPVLTTKYRGQTQYPTSFSRGQDFPLVLP